MESMRPESDGVTAMGGQPESRPSLTAAFSAIARIFTAPRGVFVQIKAGLPWWPALAVMVLIALIVALMMLPITEDLITAQMAKRGGGQEAGGQAGTIAMATSVGQAVLGLPLLALLIPTFFYWLALTITYGGAPFGRLFALYTLTGFIPLLYQIINVVYLLANPPEITEAADLAAASLNFSLSVLIAEPEGFLYGFLSQIGLFALWRLGLFVLGTAVLLQRRWQAVAWPLGIVFVLGSLLMGLMQSLGGRFTG